MSLILLAFFAIQAKPQTSNAAAQGRVLPPPKAGLLPVHEPDLQKLEPAIGEQLIDLRNTLLTLAQDHSTDDTKLSEAYGLMGQVYQAYALTTAAAQCYTNALRLAANDFRWTYLLATIHQQEGRLDEALKYYQRARQLRPDYLAAALQLGNLYVEQNRLAEAEASFTEALKLNPQCAAAHYGLGQITLSTRRFAQAAKYFEQALALAPEATRLHYALAMAYRGLGNLEQAQWHLQQQGVVGVRVVDPLVDGLAELLRGERIHLLRGRLAFAAQRFAEAIAAFRKAIAANPESVTARVNLGAALAQSGETQEAVEQFQQALKISPENPAAHFNLGVLLSQQQQHQQAIAHLRALLEQTPQDAQAYYLLAEELLKIKLPDEALPALAKAVALNADHEDALLEMVKLLWQQREAKKVLQELEKSHAQFPQKGRTTIALAYFLATLTPYDLRDGNRALALAESVYQATGSINHGAVVALALAELGRCQQAAEWQRQLIAEAERQGNATLARQLKADLPHFENAACRPLGAAAPSSSLPPDQPKKP
ncbi:MAG: tetratricopeptide repeat protein [Acidobacteria bacterium]|nr:tetratricopeptide repeat protein [Acidobacteriota bacterium]